MLKCVNAGCGAENPDYANYCRKCGSILEKEIDFVPISNIGKYRWLWNRRFYITVRISLLMLTLVTVILTQLNGEMDEDTMLVLILSYSLLILISFIIYVSDKIRGRINLIEKTSFVPGFLRVARNNMIGVVPAIISQRKTKLSVRGYLSPHFKYISVFESNRNYLLLISQKGKHGLYSLKSKKIILSTRYDSIQQSRLGKYEYEAIKNGKTKKVLDLE